jgi:hypothetical protein
VDPACQGTQRECAASARNDITRQPFDVAEKHLLDPSGTAWSVSTPTSGEGQRVQRVVTRTWRKSSFSNLHQQLVSRRSQVEPITNV